MELNKWKVNIVMKNLPQKVATAFAALSDTLIGAEYTPIAYIGSQVVNGINHAVLAEQLVLSGKDTKNIVLMIFNEKPNDVNATLISIDRIVESGMALGGVNVDVKTIGDIPEDAMNAFDVAFEGFIGARVEPFAFLGTQEVNGTNYIFVAKLVDITPYEADEPVLVVINDKTHRVNITNILENKQEAALGYAFTWI